MRGSRALLATALLLVPAAAWAPLADASAPKPAPVVVAPGAEVLDRRPDLAEVFYTSAWLDVEAAWFDADATYLYVGLQLFAYPTTRHVMLGTTWYVDFAPDWPVADPTWGGRVRAGDTLVALRAIATQTSPTAIPAFAVHVVRRDAGGEVSTAPLTAVSGAASSFTGILWWMVPRSALQNLPTGAVARDPTAHAAAAGVVADSTWGGADRTFRDGNPAFSVRYDFDAGDEGFFLDGDQGSSQVEYDNSRARIALVAYRQDKTDETYSRRLPEPLTATRPLVATARYQMESLGDGQRAFPLFLGPAKGRDMLGAAGQAMFAHESDGGPSGRLRALYVDADGNRLLDASAPMPAGAVTLRIEASGGGLAFTAVDAAGTTVLSAGTGTGAGFQFDRIGAASDGMSHNRYTSPLRAWVDDLRVDAP